MKKKSQKAINAKRMAKKKASVESKKSLTAAPEIPVKPPFVRHPDVTRQMIGFRTQIAQVSFQSEQMIHSLRRFFPEEEPSAVKMMAVKMALDNATRSLGYAIDPSSVPVLQPAPPLSSVQIQQNKSKYDDGVEGLNERITDLCETLDKVDKIVNQFVDKHESGRLKIPDGQTMCLSLKDLLKQAMAHFTGVEK